MSKVDNKPITLIQFRQRTQVFKQAVYGLPDVQPRPLIAFDFAARVKLSQARLAEARHEAREKIRAAYSHDGTEGA